MPRSHAAVLPGEIPELLAALRGDDAGAEREVLRRLCPCRNRVYDEEVWAAIYRSFEDAPDPGARHQAEHALETLWERAAGSPPDEQASDLLRALRRRGMIWPPRPEHPPRREEKIDAGDVPQLLDALAGDDPDERQRALRLLCPCRNRRYDRDLWVAILRAYEEAEDGGTRDAAGHAVGTLMERARTDPRSQELLAWLAGQGVTSLTLEAAIPTWKPRPPAGETPEIPRWERPRRSRANRRR